MDFAIIIVYSTFQLGNYICVYNIMFDDRPNENITY